MDTNLKIKNEIKPILNKKVSELGRELEKSPLTISNWIYNRPHMFKKRYILQAVKKHTGLSKNQIFETEKEETK